MLLTWILMAFGFVVGWTAVAMLIVAVRRWWELRKPDPTLKIGTPIYMTGPDGKTPLKHDESLEQAARARREKAAHLRGSAAVLESGQSMPSLRRVK